MYACRASFKIFVQVIFSKIFKAINLNLYTLVHYHKGKFVLVILLPVFMKLSPLVHTFANVQVYFIYFLCTEKGSGNKFCQLMLSPSPANVSNFQVMTISKQIFFFEKSIVQFLKSVLLCWCYVNKTTLLFTLWPTV